MKGARGELLTRLPDSVEPRAKMKMEAGQSPSALTRSSRVMAPSMSTALIWAGAGAGRARATPPRAAREASIIILKVLFFTALDRKGLDGKGDRDEKEFDWEDEEEEELRILKRMRKISSLAKSRGDNTAIYLQRKSKEGTKKGEEEIKRAVKTQPRATSATTLLASAL